MALERTTKVKLNELVYRYLKSTDESFVPQDSRRLLGATTATPYPSDLPADYRDWPSDWRDLFEERAAIMEYDGSLEKAEAERLASEGTRRLFHRLTRNGER